MLNFSPSLRQLEGPKNEKKIILVFVKFLELEQNDYEWPVEIKISSVGFMFGFSIVFSLFGIPCWAAWQHGMPVAGAAIFSLLHCIVSLMYEGLVKARNKPMVFIIYKTVLAYWLLNKVFLPCAFDGKSADLLWTL